MSSNNRAGQIHGIQNELHKIVGIIKATKDDMQASFDRTPENLKESIYGETAQERIDLLDDWQTTIEGFCEEVV